MLFIYLFYLDFGQKISGQKNNLGQRKFIYKNIQGLKKFVGPKYFGPKNFWGPKTVSNQKKVVSKNILNPIKRKVQENFSGKKLIIKKICFFVNTYKN